MLTDLRMVREANGIGTPLISATDSRQENTKDPTVEGDQHTGLFLQGTRENTLKSIRKWLEEGIEQMYCLFDVAGTGKSTLTKHIEEEWRGNPDWLVARYFFSRSRPETRNIDLFCSKVAEQFAARSDLFAQHLEDCKKKTESSSGSIENQFRVQIVEPLIKLYSNSRATNGNKPRAILIIDALDECNNCNGERDRFLTILREAWSPIPELRIFATGRPQGSLKDVLHDPRIYITSFRHTERDTDDIATYINRRLNEDKVNPFNEEIKRRVTDLAASHFIWAKVSCDLLVKASDC